MLRLRGFHVVSTVFAILCLAVPSQAVLGVVERSTKTIDATSVEFDSSFEDLDYTLGEPIMLTVTWTVLAGAVSFDDFQLKGKGYTPIAKRKNGSGDPALGTDPVVLSSTDTSVTVEFSFTDLHSAPAMGAEMGNAHFKLFLIVDTDGDGVPDTRAGFGVNFHVEDPQP